MIVCDHDVSGDTLSDDGALRIFDDEHDLETMFLFVVATIACDAGWKRARAS